MNIDLKWAGEAGIDLETGISYTGGLEKYVSALQRFYRNYDKNRKRIEELSEAKDYENLMITVHALKTNAKMIGAMEVSSGFEALETAAREEDIQYLDQMKELTMSAYKKLIDKLQPVSEMEEIHPADEISAEEAKETADRLLEALDDFNDELAKTLLKKLTGYPFRITWKGKLSQAEGFIDDFMYDEAAEVIKELYKVIE